MKKKNEDYEVEYFPRYSRSQYGMELDIDVPNSEHAVTVAQDIFGEQSEMMQVIVSPTNEEYDTPIEESISVRMTREGKIHSVVVPNGIYIESWDTATVSDWLLNRDGE